MDLRDLYQDIILEHYKRPHGRGLREPFEAEALVRVSVVFGQAPEADVHRLCRSLLTVYLSIRFDSAVAPVYR